MTIVSLIVWLLILGVVGWAIQTYAPMETRIKNILIWVLVIIAVVIVLYAFGILPIGNQQVPRLR